MEENKKDVPKKIGAYEIQGRTTSGEYTRRYVGMTDDLNRRFSEHLLTSEPNLELKKFIAEKNTFFRYTTTDTEDTAKDVEKGLYDKYKHTYNDKDHPPSGSGKCLSVKIMETNP